MKPAVAFVTLLAILTACKSTPKQPEQDAARLNNVEIVQFDPLPDEQRPVAQVVVSDAGAANDGAQVVRHEFRFFGAGGEGPAARPAIGLIEYRIAAALNNTQRLTVVDAEATRRLKKLRDDGLLEPNSPQEYMLKPDYEVHCKILECAEISKARKGNSFYGVSVSKGESVSRIKIAFTVTPLKGSGMRQGWQGEAEGLQSSKSKSTNWGVGFFGSESSSSTSPTMDEAVKLCVYDLTKKLVAGIPPRPAGESKGTTGAPVTTVPASTGQAAQGPAPAEAAETRGKK